MGKNQSFEMVMHWRKDGRTAKRGPGSDLLPPCGSTGRISVIGVREAVDCQRCKEFLESKG